MRMLGIALSSSRFALTGASTPATNGQSDLSVARLKISPLTLIPSPSNGEFNVFEDSELLENGLEWT